MSTRARAVGFLRDALAAEGWALAAKIERQARAQGISRRTLARAKRDMGVVSWRVGTDGGFWVWDVDRKNASGKSG